MPARTPTPSCTRCSTAPRPATRPRSPTARDLGPHRRGQDPHRRPPAPRTATFDEFVAAADHVVIEDAYRRAGRALSPDVARTYAEHLADQDDDRRPRRGAARRPHHRRRARARPRGEGVPRRRGRQARQEVAHRAPGRHQGAQRRTPGRLPPAPGDEHRTPGPRPGQAHLVARAHHRPPRRHRDPAAPLRAPPARRRGRHLPLRPQRVGSRGPRP